MRRALLLTALLLWTLAACAPNPATQSLAPGIDSASAARGETAHPNSDGHDSGGTSPSSSHGTGPSPDHGSGPGPHR